MKRFSAYDPNKFHAMIKSNKEKLNEIKDESNRQKPVEIDNPKKVARLLPCEETREMTPIDPLTKAVFSLDIQRLRATQTDAEFRRLLFQMLDQKTINQ